MSAPKATLTELTAAIPAPTHRPGQPHYPFASMKIGDSFGFDGVKRATVASAAGDYGKAHGMRFTTRKGDTEMSGRCWRVELDAFPAQKRTRKPLEPKQAAPVPAVVVNGATSGPCKCARPVPLRDVCAKCERPLRQAERTPA